jgi:tRNA threonylcarbamoyladenosine biosynthesis protein TsaE
VIASAVCKRAEDTQALAAGMAELAAPGDLLLLVGELGSGKTSFVQGFARGLGVVDQVTSPTFILARTYTGRLRLHHLDVYRLDHLQEVVDLGLAEIVDDGGVTLIEWGDVVTPALPADYLEVALVYGVDDDSRSITLSVTGRRWAPRVPALQRAVQPWSVER